jgi:hypothetical protein
LFEQVQRDLPLECAMAKLERGSMKFWVALIQVDEICLDWNQRVVELRLIDV